MVWRSIPRRQVASILGAAIVLVLTSALPAPSCRAHESEPAIVDLEFDQDRRMITVPASAVIAAVGLYWFVERTLY